MRLVRLPELARRERALLWLSFQRYAVMFAALAVTAPMLAYWLAPDEWWSWSLAAPVSLWMTALAVEAGRRLPMRTRALRVALHRIRAGRFTPPEIRYLCGDPLCRLVAHEAMIRAGYPAHIRRRRIRAFARDLKAQAREHLALDRARQRPRSVLDPGAPQTSAPAT